MLYIYIYMLYLSLSIYIYIYIFVFACPRAPAAWAAPARPAGRCGHAPGINSSTIIALLKT